MSTDVELLRLETDLVLADIATRLPVSVVQISLGIARDGSFLRLDGALSAELRAQLQGELGDDVAVNFRSVHTAVARCVELLLTNATGKIEIEPGPVYVVPPGGVISDATIVRSDSSDIESLRHLNPGNWEAAEWTDLLDGALGPWAMALLDGRVVSICHTPVPLTESAAEAGVWTATEFRGRALATATVAAWTQLVADSGRVLFYSTSATNLSSIRVADRLGARLVGWCWRIVRVVADLDGAGS